VCKCGIFSHHIISVEKVWILLELSQKLSFQKKFINSWNKTMLLKRNEQYLHFLKWFLSHSVMSLWSWPSMNLTPTCTVHSSNLNHILCQFGCPCPYLCVCPCQMSLLHQNQFPKVVLFSVFFITQKFSHCCEDKFVMSWEKAAHKMTRTVTPKFVIVCLLHSPCSPLLLATEFADPFSFSVLSWVSSNSSSCPVLLQCVILMKERSVS